MRFQIIAVGTKMPDWVQIAYQEYIKRFPREFKITLTEISTGKQSKNPQQLKEIEGQQILKCIEPSTITVALEVKGQAWTSEELAAKLEDFARHGQGINFLIGGPDGLSAACLKQAQYRWSLSSLTFPHTLARVVLVEQLYRAYTILRHHPYHRL